MPVKLYNFNFEGVPMNYRPESWERAERDRAQFIEHEFKPGVWFALPGIVMLSYEKMDGKDFSDVIITFIDKTIPDEPCRGTFHYTIEHVATREEE